MNEVLKKLTSYNIFNYLLPGTLFVVFAEILTSYSFVQDDLLLALFLYYFIGLVISRIGSLLIQHFLQWVSFLRFAKYPAYVAAVKRDPTIEILSETSNMYRSLCSLFFILLLLVSYESVVEGIPFLERIGVYVLLTALLVLFSFSYRKQATYITKRIEMNTE